ncbi:MAG: hypothetical protein CMQ24_11230 [Gammaproteobacteria bacterium]|nr:hypothetical protein [Gammaproteobacteria bacterium]
MKRLFTEPLVGFGVVAVGLFVLFDLVTGPGGETIVVTDAVRTRIAGDWQAQMGEVPTPEEVENLVDRWVEAEMVFREARRLGLDEGDDIVRRRMVQKMQFVVEDEGLGPPPTESELRAFLAERASDYRRPPRVSFEHRYFSADTRIDPAADVTAVLAAGEPGDGDPFLLDRSFTRASRAMAARHFGDSFADALFRLPVSSAWQGPVESAYGQHAVRVRERTEATLPPFEEISEALLADYELHRRNAAQATFIEDLRQRYDVRR